MTEALGAAPPDHDLPLVIAKVDVIGLKQSHLSVSLYERSPRPPDSIWFLATTDDIRDTPVRGFVGGAGTSSLTCVKRICPAGQTPSGQETLLRHTGH